MQAPKKIYVSIGPRQSLTAKAGQTLHSDIEFIRKDALLEYLTGRKKELLSGESFVAGERKMLKEVIEKIESL